MNEKSNHLDDEEGDSVDKRPLTGSPNAGASGISGRYAKIVLKDVLRVKSFPHRILLLYVRMNELPSDVLLTDPTIDFRNDFARARAASATPGSVRP